MLKTEVMDLTTICQSFPEIAVGAECANSGMVIRDHILQTIDDMFNGEVQLISVEGDEEVGKTTLLVQFAKSHPKNCISLFIKPSYSLGYDPTVLRYDLCNQINWVLKQEQIDPEEVDSSLLQMSLMRLRTFARSRRQKFYFVVDGLFDIPDNSLYYQNLILDMLPIGAPNFRFLFSGDLSNIPASKLKDVRCKSFPLTGFTLEETIKFFGDLRVDRKLVEELHKTCRKMPGRLASAKRILQTGVEPGTIIYQMADELRDWFQIEWKSVDTNNDLQNNVLSIVAYDQKIHNVTELAKMLGVSTDDIFNSVANIKFICIDRFTKTITFVSDSFRKFAAEKLRSRKDQALDLVISYLFREPNSDKALSELPSYLEQTERFDELLNYLSPANFAEMLKRSQSLVVVSQKADLGLKAASKLNRDGDLVRFGIQKSILMEIDESDIWRSEIEARMAINDYHSAVALAQSVYLKEDRLHLLAVLGKKIKEQGLSIEPELQEQIRSLYNDIDHAALGDRAVDIASDLIHCAPDLAIELVEKSTNNQEDDNALDWAYAKLSISAFQGNKRQRPTETLENLNLKIRDPEARRFSTDVTILVGDFTGNELLSEVEKLDNPSDKIYMLRKWAVENRDSKDSAKVVQSALDLIVKTGTYAPNASVLRELATPLPYIQDITEAIPLVSSFDGLRSSAEHSGPTQDYVMLQILLAETEAKYDFDSAGNRAVDIYLYISELKDLSVKNACMAQLVASLEKIDPEQALEIKHGIRTLSTSDLEHDLKILLESTADHYQALKGAIRALAQTVPQKALFIAFELNTEDRRDMALYEIVESVLTLPVFEIDFVFLHDIIKRINDIDYQDDLIVNILTKIHANIEGLANFQATLGVLNEARNISNLGAKCRACSLVYKILCKINDPRHTSLAEGMLKELKDAWEAIDVGWHKVDIGFKIVGTLAEESPDLAQNYFTKTEQFRDELLFDSKSTSLSYLSSLRLAIRAYSGLLPKGIDTTGDIDRITRLINRIPSYGERAFIWSELAMKMYINKRLNQCIDIVNGHLKPALQQIPQRNKNYYQMVVKSVAPALYCAHRATSFDYIASLPLELKDSALYGICQFILRKTLASEPYEYQGVQGYNIVFEEIIDLIDLMGKMNYDGWIYNIISSIADSILKNRNNFTREQIADLGRRLEQLINKKFPDLRNIKHDGYKIISLAEVARITKARNHVWLQLIDHAKSVPNLADRAFVLTVVAVAWRTNNVDTEKRWSTIKEAKELVEQIPAKYDQIEHYEMLASLVSDIDAAMCKNLIQTAMSATYEHDDLDMSQVRRRLIDLAYRVDPDLASSLASISDDDEARSAMRKKAKKHVDFLELKKGMADRKRPKELKDKLHSPLDYSQAAWTLLGSLNAGRITPCHLKDTREYVEIAAGLPLSDSYPILSWIVENAKIRFANTNEAHQFLRPMFDASLMGAELCAIMAERSYANLKRTTDNAATHQEENSILIRPKDRDVAINYLRKWIRDEAKGYIKICDPFFGPDDLPLLQLIMLENPDCIVQILTSIKHQKTAGISEPWGATYAQRWRSISDQEPPYTDIVIVGTRSQGEPPIHDRWWVSNGSGLSIGTSFNSLGTAKSTDIFELKREQALNREQEIDQYLNRVRKDLNSERLDYQIFTL